MWETENRPEGRIVECYIYEEAVKFCNEYLSNVEAIGLLKKCVLKEQMAMVKLA